MTVKTLVYSTIATNVLHWKEIVVHDLEQLSTVTLALIWREHDLLAANMQVNSVIFNHIIMLST